MMAKAEIDPSLKLSLKKIKKKIVRTTRKVTLSDGWPISTTTSAPTEITADATQHS